MWRMGIFISTKTCKHLWPRKMDNLRDGVFSVIMIFQFVSPIKLFPTQSAAMLGQLAALEPLVPSKIGHPRVPLPTLPAHVLLPFARADRDQPLIDHHFRHHFDILCFEAIELVHRDGSVWNRQRSINCEKPIWMWDDFDYFWTNHLKDIYIYKRGGREESDEKKDRKSKYDQSSDTAISRASITLLIQFVVYKRVN